MQRIECVSHNKPIHNTWIKKRCTVIKNQDGVVADVIVYLRTLPEIALTRIRKRNRQGEEDLSLEYLTKLHTYYDNWLLPINNVVVVDADNFDNIVLEDIYRQVLDILK